MAREHIQAGPPPKLLVLGGDGAMRSDAMAAWALEAVRSGSALIYVDANPAKSARCRIARGTRRLNRDEDLFLMSPRLEGFRGRHVTYNPFATGPSGHLARLIAEPGGGGDTLRALAGAVLPCLSWMRDTDIVWLDPALVCEMMGFRRMHEIADIRAYPDLPGDLRKRVSSYLFSLPGYDMNRGIRQTAGTMEAHETARREAVRILDVLAVTLCGNDAGNAPDVCMYDVMTNGRILHVDLSPLATSTGQATVAAHALAIQVSHMLSLDSENATDCRLAVAFDSAERFLSQPLADLAAGWSASGVRVAYSASSRAALSACNPQGTLQVEEAASLKVFMRTDDGETHALHASATGGSKVASSRLLAALPAGEGIASSGGIPVRVSVPLWEPDTDEMTLAPISLLRMQRPSLARTQENPEPGIILRMMMDAADSPARPPNITSRLSGVIGTYAECLCRASPRLGPISASCGAVAATAASIDGTENAP